jgi:hypothetical protein
MIERGRVNSKKTTTFVREIRKTTGIRQNCKKLPVLREFVAMCTDYEIEAS